MRYDPLVSAIAAATDPYCDRVRQPADTVAALRPHFPTFGITRIGRQTGLDRIGIPCFAAFRPNAQSLATNQGKGLTDDAAMASAVMEAIEFAIAEQLQVTPLRESARTLRLEGRALFDPSRWLPFGDTLPESPAVDWLEGKDLHSSAPILVPADLVRMNARAPDLQGVCRNTNGLASGNNQPEAVFHALCELIERDGTTLWSLRPPEEQRRMAIALETFDDPVVDGLARQIAEAGFALRLFDQTSDLGVPTVMAVLGPQSRDHSRHFEVSAGYGTHPVAARAAIRAITEAAQSRVTVIAGSRDDIDPDEFDGMLDSKIGALLDVNPTRGAPKSLQLGSSLGDLLAHVTSVLGNADVEAAVIPLGGERFGVSVVKVVSTTLEDREPNPNWRPGPRALSVILGG